MNASFDYQSAMMMGCFLFLFSLLYFESLASKKSVEVKYIEGHPQFPKKLIGELMIEDNCLTFKKLFLEETYFRVPLSQIQRAMISTHYMQRRVTLFIEYQDKLKEHRIEFSTGRNKLLLRLKGQIDERKDLIFDQDE